jgi:predicted RNA binding protein YcfA (HicA-like mRNA interferase family)
MKNQPHGIHWEEVEKVLCANGYRFDRQHGSHRQYVGDKGGRFTLPARDPVKKAYVDAVLDRIGK